jgi:hypothetical protein
MESEDYAERMRRTVEYTQRAHMRTRYYDYHLVTALPASADLPGVYAGVIRTAHVNGQSEALIGRDAGEGETRYRWAPIPDGALGA